MRSGHLVSIISVLIVLLSFTSGVSFTSSSNPADPNNEDPSIIYVQIDLSVLNRYNDPVSNVIILVTDDTDTLYHQDSTDTAGTLPSFTLPVDYDETDDTFGDATFIFSGSHAEWTITPQTIDVTLLNTIVLRAEPNVISGKKYFVLESDDWLSYSAWEMRSIEAKGELESLGYTFPGIWNLDTFETTDDLSMLFAVLRKYNVVMTPGIVTTLPDFDAIRDNGFTQYVSRDISTGLPEYLADREGVLETHQEGYFDGVWFPQYHGRTHFNTEFWLSRLRNGDQTALDHFEHYVIRASDRSRIFSEYGQFYGGVEQFSYEFQNRSISLGIDHFQNLFGFRPMVNAAVPNYHGDENTAKALKANGLMGLRDTMNHWDRNGIRRYVTKETLETQYGLVVLQTGSIRRGTLDWYYMKQYLQDNMSLLFDKVNTTFSEGRPYVDCTHRVNYVSAIAGTDWRDANLQRLDTFLQWLVNTHPEVIFLTSAEMAQILKHGYSIQPWHEKTVVRNYLKVDKNIVLTGKDCPTGFQNWKTGHLVIRDLTNHSTRNWSYHNDGISFIAESDHVYEIFIRPMPDLCSQIISISKGWNFLSFAVDLDEFGSSYTASVLAAEINAQAGNDIIHYVVMWDTERKSFREYVVKSRIGQDFKVKTGMGVILYSISAEINTFIIPGDCPVQSVLHLEAGWNFVGWQSMKPLPISEFVTNAESIGGNGSIQAIFRFNNTHEDPAYDSWVPGDSMETFLLRPGEAYWIFSSTSIMRIPYP